MQRGGHISCHVCLPTNHTEITRKSDAQTFTMMPEGSSCKTFVKAI